MGPGDTRHRDGDLQEVMAQVNEVTSQLYSKLSDGLGFDHPKWTKAEARQEAMILHTSVLGLLLMLAMAKKVGDPLKHDTAVLVDRLAKRFNGH